MKCHACGSFGPLFRLNEKGVAPVWGCQRHLGRVKPDEEVVEIVKIIEEKNNERS